MKDGVSKKPFRPSPSGGKGSAPPQMIGNGQRLKRLRMMAGFKTQDEVSTATRLSKTTISNYERGIYCPCFIYEYFLKSKAKERLAATE